MVAGAYFALIPRVIPAEDWVQIVLDVLGPRRRLRLRVDRVNTVVRNRRRAFRELEPAAAVAVEIDVRRSGEIGLARPSLLQTRSESSLCGSAGMRPEVAMWLRA